MAPRKKPRTTPEAWTSSQAPERALQSSPAFTIVRNRGNISRPLGLTNPEHISRYNALSSELVVFARYYDEDVWDCWMIFIGCLLEAEWDNV